jgi:hypothetical protein
VRGSLLSIFRFFLADFFPLQLCCPTLERHIPLTGAPSLPAERARLLFGKDRGSLPRSGCLCASAHVKASDLVNVSQDDLFPGFAALERSSCDGQVGPVRESAGA